MAQLRHPQSLALDRSGNRYIADVGNARICKVNPHGVITTVAGTGRSGYSGDGGLATSAQISGSQLGIAVDIVGNLYIADYDNHRVRRVNSNGVIETVAGTGIVGFSGDNGPATEAQVGYAMTLAVDRNGDLYVGDYWNRRVRKISRGIITTVAGNGTTAYSGDGGPATAAALSPSGVAVDSDGNLYIADYDNDRIRKVANGTISRVAQVSSPASLVIDASAGLYFVEARNFRVRKLSADGSASTITTVQINASNPALALN